MTIGSQNKINPLVLNIRSSREARKLRLYCIFMVAVFMGMFAGIDYLTGVYAPEYQRYVWWIFGFMVVWGLAQTIFLPWSLEQKKTFINLATQKDTASVTGSKKRYTVADAQAMLQRVFDRTGVKMPGLKHYYVNDDSPNAFFTGAFGTKIIAVHKGLYALLESKEIEAVLAHEVGHMIHRDVFWLVLMQSITQTFLYMAKAVVWIGLLVAGQKNKDKKGGNWLYGLSIMAFSLPLYAVGLIFAPLGGLAISRRREKLADLFSTTHGYGTALQQAFVKIEKSQLKTKPANPAIAGLYIAQPEGMQFKDWLQEILGSHPLIARRVKMISHWLSDDEGAMPDLIEYPLKWVFSWVVVPSLLGGALWYMGATWSHLFLLGRAVVWLIMLNTILGEVGGSAPSEKSSESAKPSWPLALLAFAILAFMWWTGLSAITESSMLPALTPLMPTMWWLWVSGGFLFVVEAVRKRHGILAFALDVITYLSLAYATAIIVLLITQIVRVFF